MWDVEEYLTSVQDPRVEVADLYGISAWFLGSVLSVHLILVLIVGPRFMKKRSPYSLRNALALYNLLEIACNAYYCYRITIIFLWNGVSFWCPSLKYDTTDEHAMRISYTMYFFYLIKLLNLFDTLFIVLRKKWKQLTFLHISYHISMAITGWATYRFFLGGAALCTSGVHALVQAIVYFYYFVSSYELLGVFLLKPFITVLQMAQFAVITFVLTISTANVSCQKPVLFQLLNIVLNSIYFFLFSKFFQSNYRHQGHQGFVREKDW